MTKDATTTTTPTPPTTAPSSTAAAPPAPAPRAARFASLKMGAIFVVLEEGDYIEGHFVRVGQCDLREDPLTGDMRKEVTYVVNLTRAEWVHPEFKDGTPKPTTAREIEFLGNRELKRQLRPVMPRQLVAIQRLAARPVDSGERASYDEEEGNERRVIDYKVGLGDPPREGHGRGRGR